MRARLHENARPLDRGDRLRGGAVWQLVGLITRRSQVQILPPLPLDPTAFSSAAGARFQWATRPPPASGTSRIFPRYSRKKTRALAAAFGSPSRPASTCA